MIVVTRSKKEETQEGKIKREISISAHPWSPQKGELYFDPPLITLRIILKYENYYDTLNILLKN
jgi:hypothetical protein